MKVCDGGHFDLVRELLAILADERRGYVGKEKVASLICLATRNTLLYPFVCNLHVSEENLLNHIEKMKLRCRQRATMYFKTLEHVKTMFKDDFLVLKTYDSYPYQANDVDILVRNEKILSSQNLNFKMRQDHEDAFILGDDLLTVDAYKKIAWGTHTPLVDNRLMWLSPREMKYNDSIMVLLPTSEGDLATQLAHMVCKYSFTMAEFLNVCELAKECDINVVVNQATKNRWHVPLIETVARINWFHRVLFDCPSVFEAHVPELQKVDVSFPYLFPFLCVVATLIRTRSGLEHAMMVVPEYWKACQRVHGVSYNLLPAFANLWYHRLVKTLVVRRSNFDG